MKTKLNVNIIKPWKKEKSGKDTERPGNIHFAPITGYLQNET
jgi:hypothetical protein